jgi:photosystem II stability/assembly factor-like uncharacterized protein
MNKINFRLLIFIIFLVFNFQYLYSQDWHEQFLPDIGTSHINDITFVNSLTGYACTGVGQQGYTNYVLKTTNGGDNWNIILSMYKEFSRVLFLNANTGFLSGGFNAGPLLKKTTNGGASWFDLTLPTANLYVTDISVVDENAIWAASYGDIINSTDGGNTWNLQYHAYLLNQVNMINRNLGFGGSNMYTFRTTNGGVNWTIISSFYTDISFIDSLTGWKGGYIAKTVNGGVTWVNENLPNIGVFHEIDGLSLISGNIIWGCGDSKGYGNGVLKGILYYTSDGGNNWTYQIPDTSFGIDRYWFIKFVNINTGWAYGSNKGIHTTDGGGFITGIQPSQNNIPDRFSLSQNYPNPFNPSTKISYDLPLSGFVKLMIYDVMGKVVQTLVNQKQNAGTYEVNWDASSFPSGVYFYKLQAGDFVETKKLVLIK